MSWNSEWSALSARIDAILRAVDVLLKVNADYYGQTAEEILPDAKEIVTRVVDWAARYKNYLPPRAISVASSYKAKINKLYKPGGPTGAVGISVILAGLQGELSFLLSDMETMISSSVNRSLQHLQRSIVSDSELRQRWQKAFEQGETECEKLGGTHFLLHRIWGFKVHAAGERTDLVLGTSISEDEVAASGSSLVLTEWKAVRFPEEIDTQSAQARRQAATYAGSSLAAVELRSTRYIILVSNDWIERPNDVTQAGIRYQHINIAVNPSSPSRRLLDP